MPFISDSQLQRLQVWKANTERRMETAKKKAEEKAGEAKAIAEGVGAAGLVGFVRGKYEDQTTGAWNVPGTTIDVELVIGLVLLGATMFDAFGKYDEDVQNAGIGVMAHYAGQLGRKYGKTGEFSMVAGAPLPGGLAGVLSNSGL